MTTLSNKAAEIATPCLDAVLEYHETGGHRGDGSDAALCAARSELVALRSTAPSNKVVDTQELGDEQHPRETTAEMVARLSDMLGPDTDFDNYTFSIKRGNLRRILSALRTTHSPSKKADAALWVSPGQLEQYLATGNPSIPPQSCADYLPVRRAPEGLFTQPLYRSLLSDKTVELLRDIRKQARVGKPGTTPLKSKWFHAPAKLLHRIDSHLGEMK